MDKKNEFNSHLNEIDKQHKFIILRSLAGYDYKSQILRSSILEKLYLTYEFLCFTTGKKAAPQYFKTKTFTKRMDERIKTCQECGGAFSLESG